MLRTNKDHLIEFAVQGTVQHPKSYGWELGRDGKSYMLPTVGGITYNVKIGDSVYGWEGDHIEPGASITHDSQKLTQDPNRSLNSFSCIGNRVTVLTGAAKRRQGTVIGHHGGVEHVLIDFDDKTLSQLTYDDKMLIRANGQGLKLLDYPGISVFSLSPELFEKLGISSSRDKRLSVPVTAVVPGKLMGSGLGHSDIFKGDYDIQSSDRNALKELGLNQLKFGDLIAIMDHDSSYGWCYKEGAVSIGVVVHGDSYLAGHGPGVQTILTSPTGEIVPKIAPNANIGFYLKLGRWRTRKRN
ncbi:MAG: DUF4438 domain-containing protein [Nitrospirae bacterium]|nr:DUF4438 domain-containing protein [Nitrospirota bacterium]MBI3352483.1 DUF4438 domain-containing protein [Nitrospirota bacterium]